MFFSDLRVLLFTCRRDCNVVGVLITRFGNFGLNKVLLFRDGD